MMDDTYLIGFAVLLAIIAVRWGVGYGRGHWFRRCWSKGWEAIKRKDFVGAEASFRTCVRLAPTASLAHRALGTVLLKRGKLEEAEERLRFGSDLEPRNPAGYLDLGFFYALCIPDRAEDAIDCFAKAIEYRPALRDVLAQEDRLEPLRRQYVRFRDILEGGK